MHRFRFAGPKAALGISAIKVDGRFLIVKDVVNVGFFGGSLGLVFGFKLADDNLRTAPGCPLGPEPTRHSPVVA